MATAWTLSSWTWSSWWWWTSTGTSVEPWPLRDGDGPLLESDAFGRDFSIEVIGRFPDPWAFLRWRVHEAPELLRDRTDSISPTPPGMMESELTFRLDMGSEPDMIDEKIFKGNANKSNDLGSKVQRTDTAQEALGCSQSLRGSNVLNYCWQNATSNEIHSKWKLAAQIKSRDKSAKLIQMTRWNLNNAACTMRWHKWVTLDRISWAVTERKNTAAVKHVEITAAVKLPMPKSMPRAIVRPCARGFKDPKPIKMWIPLQKHKQRTNYGW